MLRRIKHDRGERDETFGSDLKWAHNSLMCSCERGDLENKFIPISEAEAEGIVERIRRSAGEAE